MHVQPFAVTVSDRILLVRGDVDMSVSEQLLESIRRCAENREHHTIVVDLAEVTFMDSAGISALVRSHVALEPTGQTLVIQNVPSVVRLAFSMVGVTDYLNIDSALV